MRTEAAKKEAVLIQLIAEKDEEIAGLKEKVGEGEETKGRLAQKMAGQTLSLAIADSMLAKYSHQPQQGPAKPTQPKKQPTGIKRPPSGVSGGPTKGAKTKRATRK